VDKLQQFHKTNSLNQYTQKQTTTTSIKTDLKYESKIKFQLQTTCILLRFIYFGWVVSLILKLLAGFKAGG